jgi:hypothetical protein
MNQLKTLLVIGFVWPEPNSSAAEVDDTIDISLKRRAMM